MLLNDLPVMKALQGRMEYLSARQNVIATNIAHANTSGYKVRDIETPDFNALLSPKKPNVTLRKTSAMHQSGYAISSPSYASHIDKTATEETPSGNNVVLEEQAFKLSSTAQHYQEATKIYKKFSSMMKMAVDKT